MVKTPEEYFSGQNFTLAAAPAVSGMTAAEQAFLQKYVGLDNAVAIGIDTATVADAPPMPPMPAVPPQPLHETLKVASSIQMIFFHLGEQIYTIPMAAVQEVIRAVPPVRLPLAPPHVAGMMNLRGRVTPLLYLEQMLGAGEPQKGGFIIVCTRQGLQVGLIVQKIHNMFTIEQKQIIWNVESQIGTHAEFLCGIIDFEEKVYGIVSIDAIVDHVIKS